MSRSGRRVPTRSLKRRVGTRPPRKTLLVFCEGQQTEPAYLDALRREPGGLLWHAGDLSSLSPGERIPW